MLIWRSRLEVESHCLDPSAAAPSFFLECSLLTSQSFVWTRVWGFLSSTCYDDWKILGSPNLASRYLVREEENVPHSKISRSHERARSDDEGTHDEVVHGFIIRQLFAPRIKSSICSASVFSPARCVDKDVPDGPELLSSMHSLYEDKTIIWVHTPTWCIITCYLTICCSA